MKKLFVLLALVVLAGCTTRAADFTYGSTKNYDMNSGKFIKGERVQGEDNVAVVLVPFGSPNIKTAIDNAIEQDKCAVALSDIVVYNLNHSFLFGKSGQRVEGDLVLDTTIPGCEDR